MSRPDWIVLVLTLLAIIAYGLYKSRTSRDLDGYILSNRMVPWYMVLLGIMGTQASAVTFLSAPGQAFTDGMRFVQYYFGLPLAMIVVCASFVPVFRRLKVYTAYEFLEQRFDLKTRALTSFLFLVQRGVSTGISIAAPSIILSSLLGWNILWTNIFMGGLLIIYTVSGGAKAVAYTQQLQMIIIFSGLAIAGYMVIHKLPQGVGLREVLHIGGKAGKLNIITTGFRKGGGFDWNDRYNLLSGIIGGFFLQLSYFGADQSQVGRYLTARSLTESRLGLLLNGLVKVPMQFLILLLGVMVFAFYQYNPRPVFFNRAQVESLSHSKYKDSLAVLMARYAAGEKERLGAVGDPGIRAVELARAQEGDRATVKRWLDDPAVGGDSNDTNYIFLRFVTDYLPVGLIGLLIAVIVLAAWGSIAATLNSLASCTIVDFHRRFARKALRPEQEYRMSRWYTLLWGVFCVAMAQLAYNIGNSLIEAVNVLGSLFYGVILGVFLVAFFRRRTGGRAVFISAVVVEIGVIVLGVLGKRGIVPLGFLWYNVVGAVGVVVLSEVLQVCFGRTGDVSKANRNQEVG
ncbi:MAG TPA: sodium:solute symporter [Puia sp.]|jgi:SSS family solute:Na+ symporter|nr:sodium:solute symporter [Puia sp.]